MKKTLLTIIATVCVMVIGCMAYINKIENSYETKLEDTKSDYEDIKSNYEDIKSEYEDLETQVWNMKNGQPYEVSIDHDGSTYIYSCDDNKGIFRDESTLIVTDIINY